MAAVESFSENPNISVICISISSFFIQVEVFLVPALTSDFLLKHIFYYVVRLWILFRPFVLADTTLVEKKHHLVILLGQVYIWAPHLAPTDTQRKGNCLLHLSRGRSSGSLHGLHCHRGGVASLLLSHGRKCLLWPHPSREGAQVQAPPVKTQGWLLGVKVLLAAGLSVTSPRSGCPGAWFQPYEGVHLGSSLSLCHRRQVWGYHSFL